MTASHEINILSFGYGRNFFDRDNRELKRMQTCARMVGSLHMVIFTLQTDSFESYTTENLSVYPTNSRSKWHYCFDALRIGLKILRDASTHFVITTQDPFETGCVGLLLSVWQKVPLNVQEHGDFYSRSFWRRDTFSNRIRYVIGLLVLKRAHTVRVVSRRIAHALESRGVISERILHLPVRTDTLDEGSSAGPDLRLLYPDASVIILTMARLVTQKNLTLLIDAFAQLVSAEPKAQLVIVGSGPLAESLRERVRLKGVADRVSFVSWTNTPQSYMCSADIYALSSDWEGWGRVLIEAMDAGTPVVTTDVGCAGEALLHRKHGLIVSPRDTEAFARALLELTRDHTLRAEYGANARQDVRSWHVSSEAYAEAWSNVFVVTAQKGK